MIAVVMNAVLLVGTLTFSQSLEAVAQENGCGCESVLIPDFMVLEHDRDLRLAFLNVLDQASFDKIGASGSASRISEVTGLPIAKGAFDAFRERRQELFEGMSFHQTEQESLSLVKSALSGEAIAAWLECRRLCAQSAGIVAYFSSPDTLVVGYYPTASEVSLRFRDLMKEGVGDVLDFSVEISLQGGRLVDSNPKAIMVNSEATYFLERAACDDVAAIVRIGSQQKEVRSEGCRPATFVVERSVRVNDGEGVTFRISQNDQVLAESTGRVKNEWRKAPAPGGGTWYVNDDVSLSVESDTEIALQLSLGQKRSNAGYRVFLALGNRRVLIREFSLDNAGVPPCERSWTVSLSSLK